MQGCALVREPAWAVGECRDVVWSTQCTHDDVIKWQHFSRYWPLVQGIHRSLVNSPHKGQWCGALMFSLICAWINCWVNNGEAGDLRCHHTHYDITVMGTHPSSIIAWNTKGFRKGHHKTWIEVVIPCINLIPNLYIALTAVIVYVTKRIPANFIASQMDTIVIQRTLLLACVNEPENILKSIKHKAISACTRVYNGHLTLLIWRVIWWNCFIEIWCNLLLGKCQNNLEC